MTEFLAPGVYVEELEVGGKSIEGGSTSTVGFLGETERGSTGPKLVKSWVEFQRNFGGVFGDTMYLPYAVQGFFLNGGGQCYVARIVDKEGAHAAQAQTGSLTVRAIGPGAWGNRVAIKIDKGSSRKTFKLNVYYWQTAPDELFDPDASEHVQKTPQPQISEEFNDLDLREDSPNYFEKQVNDGLSTLIEVQRTGRDFEVAKEQHLCFLRGGEDGDAVSVTDYQGLQAVDTCTGLTAFEDLDDIAIIYAPNAYEINGLANQLLTHCEEHQYRFAILDVRQGQDNIDHITPMTDRPSKYAAVYYPWLKILDPNSHTQRLIPPGGHVAGIYVRSDIEHGVHKAPANEIVQGVHEPEFAISDQQQAILSSRGVNVIQEFPGRGLRVWGARTLSVDPLWKYVNVRRLLIFLEASIVRGTRWKVFEPNNERLWSGVRQNIELFLRTQWRTGALMGSKEEEAFFVKLDRSTMTQDDIDNGRLIAVIGIAPVRPAEFVIFRIAHFTAEGNR